MKWKQGLKQNQINSNLFLLYLPAITVLIHSYNRDIAEVLWIKFVNGSINFFPNRGSKGVNAPNYKKQKFIWKQKETQFDLLI
jgi:hypothetical protein